MGAIKAQQTESITTPEHRMNSASSTAASFVVFMFLIQAGTPTAQATSRPFQHQAKNQVMEPTVYITVAGMQTAMEREKKSVEPYSLLTDFPPCAGCSSHCETACCYCNIMADPPMCLQCCEESP
ncbi:hypothetical protein QQ045_009175 [Rhodiola kirilowii]